MWQEATNLDCEVLELFSPSFTQMEATPPETQPWPAAPGPSPPGHLAVVHHQAISPGTVSGSDSISGSMILETSTRPSKVND